jgi:hypothetical protein
VDLDGADLAGGVAGEAALTAASKPMRAVIAVSTLIRG